MRTCPNPALRRLLPRASVFFLMLAVSSASVAADATKEEVLQEFDLLQQKAQLKVYLDCDSAALAFEITRDTNSSFYEAARLGLTTAQLIKGALGLVSTDTKTIKADANPARAIGGILVQMFDVKENLQTFGQQAALAGADIYALEKSAEATASMDSAVAELFSEIRATNDKTSAKQVAFAHMFNGPRNGPNYLRVRNITSTTNRSGTAAYPTIAAAHAEIAVILERARQAVQNGNFSPAQLTAIRDFVRARRSDVVAGMAGTHVAKYSAWLRDGADGTAHREVATTIELGRIGAAAAVQLALLEEYNLGLDELTETVSLEVLKDGASAPLEMVEGVVDDITEANWTFHEVVGKNIHGRTFRYPVTVKASLLGLNRVLDEVGGDHFQADFDLTIQTASVKSQLVAMPGLMYWAAPGETAATLVLVKDSAEFVAALQQPASVPTAPALIAPSASLAIQAVRAGLVVTVLDSTAAVTRATPFVQTGPVGRTLILQPPADTADVVFRDWVVDGEVRPNRDLSLTLGQEKVVTLVTEPRSIAVDPTPNAGTPGLQIAGPNQLQAGQIAPYVVRNSAGASVGVARWDVSNGLASIDSAGVLAVKQALRDPTTITLLAWLPGWPQAQRLEKVVSLTPVAGERYFSVTVAGPGPGGFTFNPEPTIVDGEPLFREGTFLQVIPTLPTGWVLKNWGDPAWTGNPLEFTVTENRRIIPEVVPAATLVGPRYLSIDKPAGLGRLIITAPRFTKIMERSETRFTSNDIQHGDRVTIQIETAPDEEFLSVINSAWDGQKVKLSMIDHLSLAVRIRSRLTSSGIPTSRHAELLTYPELLYDGYLFSSENFHTHIIDNGESLSASFSPAARGSGHPDSYSDIFLKIAAYQLERFPSHVNSIELRLKMLSQQGSVQLMNPSRDLALNASSTLVWSTMPDVGSAITGRIDVFRDQTVSFNFTQTFNGWRSGELPPWGMILRSRLAKWTATFGSANATVIDQRPVLVLDWDEDSPPPVAPIVMTQSPANQTLPAGGSARLAIDARSDTAITYKWFKAGVPVPDATTAQLNIAAEETDYSVEATNAVGTTTVGFHIDVADSTPPLVAADQSIWITDSSGHVSVSGTASDNRGVLRVEAQSPSAALDTVAGSDVWSVRATTSPGVHWVKITAYDAANNLATVQVRIVNPTNDTDVPVVSGEAHRDDDGRVRVDFRAFDANGVARLSARANGIELASLTNPRNEGVLGLAAISAPNLELEVTDYAGKTARSMVAITGIATAPDTTGALNASGSGANSGQNQNNAAVGSGGAGGGGGGVGGGPPRMAFTSATTAQVVANTPFSFRVTTQPLASNFVIFGLPEGFDFDTTTGLISGSFVREGAYQITIIANPAADVVVGSLTVTVLLPPKILTQPQGVVATPGEEFALAAVVLGSSPMSYQWQKNGVDVAGQTNASLEFTAFSPDQVGTYILIASNGAGRVVSQPAMVGLALSGRFSGATAIVGADIRHANGNVYDQFLLQGPVAAITAGAGKVARMSFIDLSDDIVQVEFSGAGTLTVALDHPSGPDQPLLYNQSTSYMKGHARIFIQGADQSTHLAIFSVGRATATNAALFRAGVKYDGFADLQSVTIASANGRFGSIRTANVSYVGTSGFVGIDARNVAVEGPIYVGDIAAADSAAPGLLFRAAQEVLVAGGDLQQLNGQPVEVAGVVHLEFAAGSDSHGNRLPAMSNRAIFISEGIDVTAALVAPVKP